MGRLPTPEHADWGDDVLKRPDVVLSGCRDLVVVPGGPDWVLRELDEQFPDYCWKLAGTSSIAQYHFSNAADLNDRHAAPSKCDEPTLPIFHASVPFFYSPTDFSVQPKYLDEYRNKMCAELNEVYNTEDVPHLLLEQIVLGVACVFFNGNNFVRGCVRKMAGTNFAHVELCDYGLSQLISTAILKRMKKRFGKVPPMALHCRMKDVQINDLDGKKVDEFQQLIESCGRIVRVELTSVVEPYVVNLYHPTVMGMNLGKLFYRRPEDEQRERSKQRKWLEHLRREANENDSDVEKDEDYWSSGDESFQEHIEEKPITLVRRLPKAPKACRLFNTKITIGHIENASNIFLHDEWQLARREKIQAELQNQASKLLPLPRTWLEPETACVFVDSAGAYRGLIEEITNEYIELILCDHGRYAKAAPGQLFALPEHYGDEPQAYPITLHQRSIYPHPSYTRVLRDLLADAEELTFTAERKYNRLPMRGILRTSKYPDILNIVEET
ncbi:unnamed protein product, partial [Mesorhabditis spiculigera]